MTVVQHNSTVAVTSAADAPSRLCHYAVAMEIRGDFACRCCDYVDARMSFFPPGEAMPVAADARVRRAADRVAGTGARRFRDIFGKCCALFNG